MISDRELEADEHDGETETVRPLPPSVNCALTYAHFVDGSAGAATAPSFRSGYAPVKSWRTRATDRAPPILGAFDIADPKR